MVKQTEDFETGVIFIANGTVFMLTCIMSSLCYNILGIYTRMAPAEVTWVAQSFRKALYVGSKLSSLSLTVLSEGAKPSCP